jgi:hypothetical protein
MVVRMKIEVKSISSGKAIRLSSIMGWTVNQLPKVLIIFHCSKQKASPIPRPDGTQTKARDVEVTIDDYTVHFFGTSASEYFVQWTDEISFEEVTQVKWRDNPNFLSIIREMADECNRQSKAPIKLRAEKNGENCRIHYGVSDYRKLPDAPKEVMEEIEPRINMLKGATMKLWKDHSAFGIQPGYVTEEMIRWEDENNQKATGRLDVFLKNGEVRSYPSFRQGRQDYWGGFAIETLLEDLNEDLNKTAGGTMGADLTLESLGEMNFGHYRKVEIIKSARKIGKHAILREIQSELNLPQLNRDVSKGSTVTKYPLDLILNSLTERYNRLPIQAKTKAECIRISLSILGRNSEADDFSRGGTITAYALLKILNGIKTAGLPKKTNRISKSQNNMPPVVFHCLHQNVTLNGGATFDLFQGYLSANEILDIADVPRFSDNQTNISIVNNIPPKQTPVLKWQRPLMQSKVDSIAETYSSAVSNNLMPNPIILAADPNLTHTANHFIRSSPVTMAAGAIVNAVPNLYEISVGIAPNTEKPIWILDGQHRTYGMQATQNHVALGGVDRSNEKIPFILLFGPNYTPEMLAEIFTHVTSGATEMHPIHKAWMHYSFSIPMYDNVKRHSSLEVATHLCFEGSFGNAADGTVTNPFYDKIRFNPKLPVQSFYAFEFDANVLADFVYNNYYKDATNSILTPLQVAEQLCYSIKAFEFHDQHSASHASAKTGSRLFEDRTKLSMLANCYVTAVLQHLVNPTNHKTYNQWKSHLSDSIRQFDNSDWDLTWIGALDGATSTDSKTIAENVFLHYLNATVSIGHKPSDYLRGAGAKIVITSHYWNQGSNRKRTGAAYPSSVPKEISVASPNQSFTMGSPAQIRTGITVSIHPDCKNLKIKSIHDYDINPNQELRRALSKGGLDVDTQLNRTAWGSADKLNVAIKTISFSGSTEETTAVRLDRI